MPLDGYIYIVLRADFIEDKKYIYKIGETSRYPPHRRLWEYPYGSLFVGYIKTASRLKFEKKIKQLLKKYNLSEIGDEYYNCTLNIIIDCIKSLYSSFNINTEITTSTTININYLLLINRLHYIVNYDDCYFQHIYQYNAFDIDIIPTDIIYQSYLIIRRWYPTKYPDNYVIRCGIKSITPNHPICCHIPRDTIDNKSC